MFLHPWAIGLGAAAVALPVLVHWLTRPKPIRRPWSAMKFVREVVQQRRARHRLRDIIILSLRTLAIVLIALAMSRPLWGPRVQAAADEGTNVVRVVILDVSQSQAALSGGAAVFERARPLAAKRLEYQPGLKANLILAAARPRAVFPAPSTNFGALQEALSTAAVAPERLQVGAALNAAAEMLAPSGSPGLRRELVILSDFQRSNWSAADFSVFPEDTQIELESLGGPSPSNLAVLGVTSLGAGTGQEVELAVDVGNYSSTPRDVRVETRLADAVVVLEGTCPPLSRTRLTGPLRVPALGWHVGTSRLLDVDDALAADNSRPCAIELRPPPALRLLTRQPEEQAPSSSYYLARGLVPEQPQTPKTESRLVRLDPANVDRERLSAADVLLLDHPGRLSAETVQLLVGLIRRGRGLLYIAAEPADATNIQQIVTAAGSDLKLPVTFTPSEPGRNRGRTLNRVSLNRAPFAVFGDQSRPAWSQLAFDGGLASRRANVGLAEDVRATFNDQSAFLVSTSLGAGRMAIVNADLMSSDLPHSSVWVPLLAELTQELASSRGRSQDVPPGEPATVAVHVGDEALEGLSLDASVSDSARGELLPEAGGMAWHADAAPPPGVIAIRRSGNIVAAVVTGLPAEESDLRPLSADVLKTRLGGGRSVVVREHSGSQSDPRDTLWTWLAAACALCLTSEALALWIFRT